MKFKYIMENRFYHYGAEVPIEEIRFPMGIRNDFITIFGKDFHIWNNAPRSLLSNVT